MELYNKLLEIRKSVNGLKKTARNEHYNYDYTPSSEVIGAVRDKMNELGVLLIPEVTSAKIHTGGKQTLTELGLSYQWVNVENPEETLTVPWYAQGVDSGERGPGKAYTYGEKYFIKKFFNIPDDKDDPDASGDKFDGQAAKPQQAAAQPAPAQESPQIRLKKKLEAQNCDLSYVALFMLEKGMVKADANGAPDMKSLSPDTAKQMLDNFSDFMTTYKNWAGPMAFKG